MRIFLFVLFATIFEATGDALIRKSLHHDSSETRLVLYGAGALFLTLYGTFLNLAPVEFAEVVGWYIACLFLVFQITNYVFFHTPPTMPVVIGGTMIVAGGLLIGLWK